ncbi:MAG: glycosyltransferase family 4 protein [Chloroflexi bacterium]|nr:glycosyltransferase family 4 protein [Chloroflexota bacterium]
MRVFLITSVPLAPPWDQGDKNLAYMLTRVLPNHRFRVLTARHGSRPPGDNLELLPLFWRSRPSLVQKATIYSWLLRQGRATDPDLYHLVYLPYALSAWLGRLAPTLRRRPVIHTVTATASGPVPGRRLFFADRVVALSEYGRQKLQQAGVPNVVYIPPGIETGSWIELSPASATLKADLGLAGRPVVFFPGHYGPGYGADVLMRALPAVVAAVPEVAVLFACRPRLAGDLRREEAARQTVDRAGLARNALFYNIVADIRPLLGASDMTVLPLETMRDKVDIPTTLLESLAAARPVIISDIPPMNELAQHGAGGVGLVVPPGDSQALAEAMIHLLQNRDQRTQMGRRGQELVRECYDIQHVARQYDKLYQEVQC